MSQHYYLGIDIGTSSTKTLLTDQNGKRIAQHTFFYKTMQPFPGYVEQDPEITWWKGALVVLIAALIVTLHYRHLALTRLGGTTGDLAGWFLQKCELWCLLVLAVAAHLF